MEQVAIAGVLLEERPRFNIFEVAHKGRTERLGMFEIPWWEFEKTTEAPAPSSRPAH
jgi:hypothetical protein